MKSSVEDLRRQVDDVERGLAVVRQVLEQERDASKPDKYNRVPAEMPPALRGLYDTGTWRNAPVYCWDLVLSVSREGHEKSKAAENRLLHMSHDPSKGLQEVGNAALRAEHSPAVLGAAAYSKEVSEAVASAIRASRESRSAHLEKLATEYRILWKKWRAGLKAKEAALTQKEKDEKLASDRLLVMATRSSSGMGGGMSVKECDTSLAEIASSGGTAGGLSRWSASVATIPSQDLNYRPPDGGVLIDDPLAAHYAAKNINPWTRAERLLFLEKFLSHNKNFRRIASFFEHKSVEDVVRFYFDNKKPLKLKQLAKDAQVKKRSTKKNALVELSRLPTESRSIKNNFVGEAASDLMEGHLDDGEDEDQELCSRAKGCSSVTPSELGQAWKPRDRQALIFSLCRHKIDDDFSSSRVPPVWCRVSYEVRTKTPAQCREFYVHFRTRLGLDRYHPPELPARTPAKRPRSADAFDDVCTSEPLATRVKYASGEGIASGLVEEHNSSEKYVQRGKVSKAEASTVPRSAGPAPENENQVVSSTGVSSISRPSPVPKEAPKGETALSSAGGGHWAPLQLGTSGAFARTTSVSSPLSTIRSKENQGARVPLNDGMGERTDVGRPMKDFRPEPQFCREGRRGGGNGPNAPRVTASSIGRTGASGRVTSSSARIGKRFDDEAVSAVGEIPSVNAGANPRDSADSESSKSHEVVDTSPSHCGPGLRRSVDLSKAPNGSLGTGDQLSCANGVVHDTRRDNAQSQQARVRAAEMRNGSLVAPKLQGAGGGSSGLISRTNGTVESRARDAVERFSNSPSRRANARLECGDIHLTGPGLSVQNTSAEERSSGYAARSFLSTGDRLKSGVTEGVMSGREVGDDSGRADAKREDSRVDTSGAPKQSSSTPAATAAAGNGEMVVVNAVSSREPASVN